MFILILNMLKTVYISVYRISVYRISVYRISVYRISVYRISVYRISVYRICVYRISVYRISVYRISVYRISVYRISVYRIPSSTRANVNRIYCRSSNICEVLIFANFTRKTNSQIQESRELYHDISAIKEQWKFTNSKLCEKSQNQKFAKI